MTAIGARARVRAWAWAVLALALVAGAALALAARRSPDPLPERPPAQRPALILLTSLPLIFAETFSLDSGGSPALTALEGRYRVEPIGITDAASLKGGGLLLMAHPRAQTAEALVELDAWVRGGGRVVLLADPKLDWPSGRPLGDRLAPPPSFADTGLLRRWGLTLYAPETNGPAKRKIGGRTVELSSPGTLDGDCQVVAEGLIARCRIGRGLATVIADADLLNAAGPDSGGIQLMLAELERIER